MSFSQTLHFHFLNLHVFKWLFWSATTTWLVHSRMYELNEPFNLTGLYPKRQLCQEPTNFISVSRCFWLMPVLQHQQRAKQNPDRGVKFLMSKFGCLKKKWENHFIFVFECSRSVPFPGIQYAFQKFRRSFDAWESAFQHSERDRDVHRTARSRRLRKSTSASSVHPHQP